MTSVSARIDRSRTAIINLLGSVQQNARICSLTDRIHYIAFQLREDDIRASNTVRQIVILIENHAQECTTSGSFLQCLHASGSLPAMFSCV